MLQNVIVNFIIHYHKILVVISGYFEKWMETIQQIADFVSPQDLRPIGARPEAVRLWEDRSESVVAESGFTKGRYNLSWDDFTGSDVVHLSVLNSQLSTCPNSHFTAGFLCDRL